METSRLFQVAVALSLVLVLACPAWAKKADLGRVASHPRLYVTKDFESRIGPRLSQEPYATFFRKVRKRADDILKKGVPASFTKYSNTAIRPLGDGLVTLAMVGKLTGKKAYREALFAWMRAFAKAPSWGGDNDIGAAHVMFGLSVAFDWYYYELPPDLKKGVITALSRRARAFDAHFQKKDIWWAKSPMQNHNHVNAMALGVTGLALWREAKDAGLWVRTAQRNMDVVLDLLSPDGASHEGVGYWSYSLEALLKYYFAFQRVLGLYSVSESPFFQNTARFRLHASTPGFASCADYADSPEHDYKGPGHLLRGLARIFKDPHAQWLAFRIEKARGSKALYSWMDIVWYDPEVGREGPGDMPEHGWFPNLGLLFSRSSWDDSASYTFYKAGPPQGYHALEKGVWAGSHIHPDEGTFSFWADGKWLVMDDGYVMMKRTANHNTLTFSPAGPENDTGQAGEGGKWFKAMPAKKAGVSTRVEHSWVGGDVQYIVTRLDLLYPRSLGLKSWERHFISFSGRGAVVFDRVVPAKPVTVTSRFHVAPDAKRAPGAKAACLDDEGGWGLELAGDASGVSFEPSVLEVRPMGKFISKPRKVLAASCRATSPVDLLALVRPGSTACSAQGASFEYDPQAPALYMELDGVRYRVDFSRRTVEEAR